eukprot:28317-Rhodomonas_salina.7
MSGTHVGNAARTFLLRYWRSAMRCAVPSYVPPCAVLALLCRPRWGANEGSGEGTTRAYVDQVGLAIGLRACYAMPDTDVACAAIVLGSDYAISCIDIRYDPFGLSAYAVMPATRYPAREVLIGGRYGALLGPTVLPTLSPTRCPVLTSSVVLVPHSISLCPCYAVSRADLP